MPQTICYRMQPEQKADPWEFPIHAGVFQLHFDAVVRAFTAHIQHQTDLLNQGLIRKESGAYDEYLADLAFADWLKRAESSGVQQIIWEECFDAQADRILDKLITSHLYDTACCPECQKAYCPSELSIEEWKHSDGYEGGTRVICPRHHTLYASVDWVQSWV